MIESEPLSNIIGAGQLNERVQLEKLTILKQGGEAVPSWATYETLQAYFEETPRDESVDSGAVTAYGMGILVVRWFPGIFSEDPNLEAFRINLSADIPTYQESGGSVVIDVDGLPVIDSSETIGTYYNIRHIEELGRRRYLRMTIKRWN